MQKIIFILTCIITLTSILTAQENVKPQAWNYELTGNLNISQVALDNWVEGGENVWAWQFNLAGKATQEKENFKWRSTGLVNFGKSKIGKTDSRKAIDEIRLETVYTRKLGFQVSPYAAATARTQFAKGYSYTDTTRTEISAFMDPGYFTQSVGMGYMWKDNFTTRLGASLKESFASKHASRYTNNSETADKIEKSRVDFGMESVTDLKLSFSDNLLITSQLILFTDFSALNTVDVDWDNKLTATINKYLNVNLSFRLFYDRDLHVKRQIKEALAIGLTYNFF